MVLRAPIQVQLPPLHPAQDEVRRSPARFRVVDCGRRWGKSLLAVLLAMETAAKGGAVWWIAPDMNRLAPGTKIAHKLTYPLRAQGVYWKLTKAKSDIIHFPGGGYIEFRTANDPQVLRGDSLDLAIFDEFAFVDPAAWDESVSPMLTDRMGRAIFISTPFGRNHYHQMFQSCGTLVEAETPDPATWTRRVNDSGDPDWAAFKFPSSTNPFFPPSELERERRAKPERIFRAEYLAEFIDDASAVFRGVREAAIAEETPPEPGHVYVVGGDLARVNDFTVFIVFDVTAKRQVKKDHFNRISYDLQIDRLDALCAQYKPVLAVIESNKESDVVKRMAARGIPVQPIYTTGPTKSLLIESWSAAIEHGDALLLNWDVLIKEHLAYEVEQLPGGTYRYNAPKNQHDDTVMASAFAWYAVAQTQIRHQPAVQRMQLNAYQPGTRRRYPSWRKPQR